LLALVRKQRRIERRILAWMGRHGLGARSLSLALLLGALGAPSRSAELPVERIKLPSGFAISVWARVPGARSLARGPGGTVFVGTRGDTVYAVVDADRNGTGEQVTAVARGLDSPNGVAVRDGALYVAEISRVLRFDAIEERLAEPPAPVVVSAAFPDDRHHGWKFIRFSPDGMLYVPVGAPCNVCERQDARYASIMRMKPDGSGLEVFAAGVRNTVGFDWHPVTGDLWFTDNGRDMLGDDLPPDELNRAPAKGLHFGFPYCHGGFFLDPDLGKERSCEAYAAPAAKLGAHVASLGMRFYTGRSFPAAYRDQVLIAEHGSWNRSERSGYRITLVRLEEGRVVAYEPFAQGWLSAGEVWGRPVDLEVLPDGSLLVSDDHAGAIYRITYGQVRPVRRRLGH
jgi:glucose/arabinose dehydrogenase